MSLLLSLLSVFEVFRALSVQYVTECTYQFRVKKCFIQMFLIEMNQYSRRRQLIKVNEYLIYVLLKLSEYKLNTDNKLSN
jgi:hypothetical protein